METDGDGGGAAAGSRCVSEEALKTEYFHRKPRTITQDRHKPHSPRRLRFV